MPTRRRPPPLAPPRANETEVFEHEHEHEHGTSMSTCTGMSTGTGMGARWGGSRGRRRVMVLMR